MLPIRIIQCQSRLISSGSSVLLSRLEKQNLLRSFAAFTHNPHSQCSNNLRISSVYLLKPYSTEAKKGNLHLKAVKGREIIQDVLQQKKQILQEKKQIFQDKKDTIVKDIKDKKDRVKERVETVIQRENIFTIPNLLCVGRIAMSPYLGYVIIQSDFTLAMGLMIAAGLTDLADGYIARTWPGQASNFGSFLDPLADKLLMGTLCISLSYCDLLPVWLTFMILFRDLFLIGAGFVIRFISLPPPRTLSRYFDATHATAQLAPTFISKVNTVVQLFTVGVTLGAPIWNYVDHPYLHGLWYLTGFTTAWAALSYVTKKNTYKFLKK